MSEYLENKNTIHDAYETLLAHEPKLISAYVPGNAAEQKKAFLAGEIRNPTHVYDKLEAIDFELQDEALQAAGDDLLGNPELPVKHRATYGEFVANYRAKTELLRRANAYNHATTDDERQVTRQAYMQLNQELYGTPDETTYRSLLNEKLATIRQKATTDSAKELYAELQEMLPGTQLEAGVERFKPSPETVQWMQQVAEGLYEGMLAHVPEQDTFSPSELQQVFSDIIHEEFGEAAAGWRVDVGPAQSINVKAGEKRIIIPENRGEISRVGVRRLVVHEIGVHMLRSVMGEETDLEPLRTGLSEYYDAEEGLGVVMEQALVGRFSESGIDHYLTAGMAGIDGMDFRQVFENKWRIAALSALKEGQEVTDEIIAKAKDTAYKQVMRSLRGTDDLPWFKDLAYYNGSINMWRHLEAIRGDDVKFMFVLLGKADSSKIEHERIVYETKTVA